MNMWGLLMIILAVPYISAVSKNVQPQSMALSIKASASFSVDTVPYAWLIPIHPNPISDTSKSLPKILFSMFSSSFVTYFQILL